MKNKNQCNTTKKLCRAETMGAILKYHRRAYKNEILYVCNVCMYICIGIFFQMRFAMECNLVEWPTKHIQMQTSFYEYAREGLCPFSKP